jgi:hypothetical protein
VWHEKEPSLPKAMSAKFAALSLAMVKAATWLKNCSGDYRQTNKQN